MDSTFTAQESVHKRESSLQRPFIHLGRFLLAVPMILFGIDHFMGACFGRIFAAAPSWRRG